MLGKHLLKLFSYANESRNRFLNVSVKPCFGSRSEIKPFVRTMKTELSEPIVSSDVSVLKPETASLYYWRYFMNNNYYDSYFNNPNINSSTESNFKSIKLLSNLANVQIFTEENIKLSTEALNHLEKEISSYGLEDIRQALSLTFKCKLFVPETDSNLEKMKTCIDEELCKRYLSSDESLAVLASLSIAQKGFFRFQNKNLYFVVKSIMKLLSKINSLTPQQIVLLFFCAPPKDLSRFDSKYYILSYLDENLSKFNSDELGIIALGLYNLNLNFNHAKIFQSFVDKTLEEIENIHSVPFRSVCKVLQKFMKFPLVPNSLEFQERLIPYVSKLDSLSILEASLLCAKQNAINESLKDLLKKHLIENISHFSTRSFLRLLSLTVSCNIREEALLIPIIKELEVRASKEGGIKNELHIIKLMKEFSHHQLYSQPLLNKVFSPETFLTVTSRNFPVSGKVSWWSLYCNINLEKPEYCNTQLQFASLRSLHRENKYLMNTHQGRFDNRTTPSSISNLRRTLVKLYDEDKVFQTYTLSHYDPGIVLIFNQDLQAQNIPEKFKLAQEHFNKKPLTNDNYWIFITFLNFNDFLWKTNTLKLSKQTLLRQLQLLGYVPLTVKFSEFKEANMNDGEQFMKNLIEDKLRSLSQEKPNVELN